MHAFFADDSFSTGGFDETSLECLQCGVSSHLDHLDQLSNEPCQDGPATLDGGGGGVSKSQPHAQV